MFNWHTESKYLGRYAGSGFANTLCGFATIFLMMWLGFSPLSANVAGYAVGIFIGFILTKRFVFRSNGHIVTESFRYLIAFTISFICNLLALRASLDIVQLNPFLAQIVSAAFFTISMYILTRLFVFMSPKQL